MIGLLVLYDSAIPLIRSARPHEELPALDRIYCVGYPTLAPSADVLDAATAALGVPVEAFPTHLDPGEFAAIFEEATRLSNDIQEREAARFGLHRIAAWKANDRVYYRIAPWRIVVAMLEKQLAREPGMLLVPWLNHPFDLVERSGMLGFDAAGKQGTPLLLALAGRKGVACQELWPSARGRERWAVHAARAAMLAARVLVLSGRAFRDMWTDRKTLRRARKAGNAARPRLGVIVGGASQWNSVRPVIDRDDDGAFDTILLTHDIIRNPTARRTLRAASRTAISLGSFSGPLRTLGILASTACSSLYRTMRLRLAAMRVSPAERERLLLLEADVAQAPEIELFADQLRRAIAALELDGILSANNVDTFLSVTTSVCRDAGIPHVCIHNAATQQIALPAYADCDLFLAESADFARFIRAHGARGTVEAVGLPYYDELVAPSTARDTKALERALPQVAGRRVIGVTTQTDIIDFRPILEALLDEVKGRSDLAIVIKLHPREDSSAYADFGARLAAAGLGGIVQHMPLQAFLDSCSCLVTVVSTTVISAIVNGLRPFSWRQRRFETFVAAVDYMRPEVTSYSHDPVTLARMAIQSLDDPDETAQWRARRDAFMATYMTGADGMATRRVRALIGRCIKSSH